MIGTVFNACAILLGGLLGKRLARVLDPVRQRAIKAILGVVTVVVGLRLVWMHLTGHFWHIGRQLLILVLALALGRIAGRLLRLQKASNRLGQIAKANLERAGKRETDRASDGFFTASLLFCAAPLALLGPLVEGFSGRAELVGVLPLVMKGVMDGLTAVAFAPIYGWSVLFSVVPLLAYQGTLTLLARLLLPWLAQHGLVDSVLATAGLLIFCVALIILELRKVEVADYFPSLFFAPLLTWVWR